MCLNSRIERTEERISQLEGRAIEINQPKQQREKRLKKKNEPEPQGTVGLLPKIYHSCLQSARGEVREGEEEKEVISENFSTFSKDIILQIQEAE